MLGEGIVSFGVWPAPAFSRRNVNASPKIVSSTVMRSCTFSAADSKSSSPFAFRKCTMSFSSVRSTPASW